MQAQPAYLYLDFKKRGEERGKGRGIKKGEKKKASGVSNAGKVRVITVHRGNR